MTGKKIPPLDSREFLSEVRDFFGDSYVIRLFKITLRTYQRWTARTPYADEESVRENYLEKHEKILKRLMKEDGGEGIARAIVARHAELVGCDLCSKGDIEPDRDTLAEECLDDYPALAAYHEAMTSNESPAYVCNLKTEAFRELDETYAIYLKKYRKPSK